MHILLKHVLVWLMWIGLTLLGGIIAAVAVNEHGSIGLIFFAFLIGIFGSLGTSALMIWQIRNQLGHGQRIALLAVVSSAPIVAVVLYGWESRADYSAMSAFMFYLPFGIASLALAVIADIVFLSDTGPMVRYKVQE
jgi:FtsH-binding integral membrane protein